MRLTFDIVLGKALAREYEVDASTIALSPL